MEFSKLPKEKQIRTKKLMSSFLIKNVLSGVSTGGLIVISNLVLYFINDIYGHSNVALFFLCLIVDIALLQMAISSLKARILKLQSDLQAEFKK